jgi:excisionase family DNA binding protein
MSYSLAEAAKATGTNKTTILRAIKSGKISGERDEHGNWRLEPAEVHRVYEPVVRTDAEPPATQHNALTDLLVVELRATIADKNAVIADLRSDRNEWREAHERAQAALTEAIAAAQRLLPAPDAAPVEQDAPPIEHSAAAVEQGLMAVERALMPTEQEARAVEQEARAVEEEATEGDLPRLGRWQRALDMLASMGSAPARIRA